MIASAQSRIIYQYDGAGNRVARKVSVASANAKASPEFTNPQATPLGEASASDFSAVYSSKGDVTVIDISQRLQEDAFTISVYGTDGTLLFSTKRGKGTSTVPFSKFPRGMYLVCAENGKWKRSAKVTKH